MSRRTIPSRIYKRFEVRVVPRDMVHFGYEIRGVGASVIRSVGAFLTAAAAFDAACAFVDEVDRRVGLGSLENPPEG